MFSLQSAGVCACVSVNLLAPSPVGLADSLHGHMAERNYTLCTSLAGEYLSASVCSFRIGNSQCLFCFTLCAGVDVIVHIARGQCTAQMEIIWATQLQSHTCNLPFYLIRRTSNWHYWRFMVSWVVGKPWIAVVSSNYKCCAVVPMCCATIHIFFFGGRSVLNISI